MSEILETGADIYQDLGKKNTKSKNSREPKRTPRKMKIKKHVGSSKSRRSRVRASGLIRLWHILWSYVPEESERNIAHISSTKVRKSSSQFPMARFIACEQPTGWCQHAEIGAGAEAGVFLIR